jgi:myo-inositol-1(or 4)-monophosphatase
MTEHSQVPQAFDLTELLSVAIEAAERASEALLARYRPSPGAPLEFRYKGPGDLVTDADFAWDRAIAEVLRGRNAPGNILSEESVDDKGDARITWLIDPLCGTLPFSTGLPHWGVSIALSGGNALELGVVALPTSNELLSAIRGQGAYLTGGLP